MRIFKGWFAAIVLIAFCVVPAKADFDDALAIFAQGDYQTAFEEFKVLAEKGDLDSQLVLATMYVTDLDVPQDPVLAYMWLDIAAAQGSDLARRALPKFAKNLTPEQLAEAQRKARAWQPTP